MSKLSKSELIKIAANKHGITVKAMTEIVDTVLDTIMAHTAETDGVDLFGFGSFVKQDRKARAGRNPKTGEEIKIPARTVITFRPKPNFKAMVA